MLSNIDTNAVIATKESFTNVFLDWLKSDEEELTVTWLPSKEMSCTESMEFSKVFQYIPSHPELVIILRQSSISFWNKSTGQFLFHAPDYLSLLNNPIPDEFMTVDKVQEELEKKVAELFLLENKESFEKELTDIRAGKGLGHFWQMEWRWVNLSDIYDEQKSLVYCMKDYGLFDTELFHYVLAYWLGDTSAANGAKEYYEKEANKSLGWAIRAFCEKKFCREEYKPSKMALRAKEWASAVKNFVQEKNMAGKNIVKLRIRICDSCGNVKVKYVPWERLTIPWDYYSFWDDDFNDEEITSISYGGKIIVGRQ